MCGSRKYPYPTTEGIGNSGGWGSKAQEIPRGRGNWRRNSCPDGRKSIDSLHALVGATYQLSWDGLKLKAGKLQNDVPSVAKRLKTAVSFGTRSNLFLSRRFYM